MRLIGRQRRAGVTVGYSLQALHGIVGICLQRATEQFVVKARAEYPALALVERRTEFFVVLDFGGQGLQFSRRGVVSGRDIVQLIIDDIAFGEKLRPEIGLRLIVLEVR